MGLVVRLMEKLTGTPHRHEHKDNVAAAAKDLTASIQELAKTLKPYRESNDPLVALMTDIFNQRQMMVDSENARTDQS
jgi:hypothetical protein